MSEIEEAVIALQHDLAAYPELFAPNGGKMFGVLRCKSGLVLRAFSGMLRGSWTVPTFVGPTFDAAARAVIEVPGEREVRALTEQIRALRGADDPRDPLRDALDAMRARHVKNRAERHAARARGGDKEVLDQQSRHDKAEMKRLLDALGALPDREAQLRTLEEQRRVLSASLMRQIQSTYRFQNARGEKRSLEALFAPQIPPSGAGDCAAPKLLCAAFERGEEVDALVEFFWGDSTARRSGAVYAPCTAKCGAILAFMRGLPPERVAPENLPRIVFQDDHIIVIDKPAGLLSVPGKTDAPCVADWLDGARLAHRLDQDTSGLLVAARDHDSYVFLQRQFAERTVHKRYVAVLDGLLKEASGTISLPLRVDLDDRPRQIHDPVHGKPALTQWQVLAQEGNQTRVALVPLTGRTHQLRVHCAHGLALPIVGDRLYGKAGERLLLHAESLSFVHPGTRETVSFSSPAPF
jgi:tRNA pseudouridine32 synthase/23S rRNA pseudouridine746 synthase